MPRPYGTSLLKIRECFLAAVALLPAEGDAREAWVAMNRKNAPWAAVFEGERLVGLLNGGDLREAVQTPEVFVTLGGLAREGAAARRALRLPPDGELGEAAMRMELAGADAAFVEGRGRPPGVLELARAREALGRP